MITLAILTLLQTDARDRCVLLSAEVRKSPPKIELRWTADPKATEYAVYRRALTEPTWGSSRARLEAGATSYADADVVPGDLYEYKISKMSKGEKGVFEGTGYLRSGIEAPLADRRGKVILLVEAEQAKALAAEVARLEQDLAGDGWIVLRHDVEAASKPPDVKAVVKKDWEADRAAVRALFILGHVAVPYSGRYNPDGHPDHLGAWPADSYYGDLDVEWTDEKVDHATPARAESKNVPGDGKFDPSQLPSDVELEVGRVDLSRMPAFGKSATELLKRYLDRNHAWRQKSLAIEPRALVCDQFGDFRGEAFVSGSWRGFPTLVGADKIETGDWFKSLTAGTYLFAHGSGAGGWQSCAGVGTTADFAAKPSKAVFNALFGSYFGDWDAQDSLLRAPLASDGAALAVYWTGRPHWYVHALGMGETLGYVTRATQNNHGLYAPMGAFPRGVHLALMGDPTLRIHPVAPPTALVRKGDRLSWQPSAEAAAGYHVYRKDEGIWKRLTEAPIREAAWTDPKPAKSGTYMIRALRVEVSPSGSYVNASQALFETP